MHYPIKKVVNRFMGDSLLIAANFAKAHKVMKITT